MKFNDKFSVPEDNSPEDDLWDAMTGRLNELDVENNEYTRNVVSTFMNTPGATLVVLDKPKAMVFVYLPK